MDLGPTGIPILKDASRAAAANRIEFHESLECGVFTKDVPSREQSFNLFGGKRLVLGQLPFGSTL